MSEQKKYTAEDIRLYLEGKLSPGEMHAMERESLDDPFLADAIEGMQQLGNNEMFFLETARLKESLNERIRKKRRTVMLPVPMIAKIAAVLIVVGTGVAIIIYTGQKSETQKIEIVKKEEKLTESGKADTNRERLYNDSVVATYKQEKPVSTFKKQEVSQVPPAAAVHDAAEAETYDKGAAPLQDSLVKNENPGKGVPQALEGRAAGVEVSRADSTLQEVVVVAYGVSKKQKPYNSPLAKSRTERRIVPEGGWQQFEAYLGTNKNTNAYDTTLTGTEKLSFIVDSTRRPTAITVIHSLSAAHDAEAIRLINEGPDWTIKKGNRRKVVLSLEF